MYYNSDAPSHHLLYDRLFSLRLEEKEGNGNFSWKQFLHSQPPCCCLNAHSCAQISVWCLNVETHAGPVQVHSSGTSLACQIFIEVFTQSHLKNPNHKHWRVTQRADTVESYRKESRESLFLATAKKRKLIAWETRLKYLSELNSKLKLLLEICSHLGYFITSSS